MPAIHDALDASIREVEAARKRVSKANTKQVRGVDEIGMLQATAQTWFHTHRPMIATGAATLDLAPVDNAFTTVLDATARHAVRTKYAKALKEAKIALIGVRKAALLSPAPPANTDDLAPDFSPLVGNTEMQNILVRRWNECTKCVQAEAHLAAIVMMGGLLEALFVARANRMPDKTSLTSATSAPKDKVTGKTINYQEWMLDSYIKVAFELKWITESAKDVADKLKEYRNFIHPAKELRYGVTLSLNDSSMFWQVTKALARQLLRSG